MTEFAGKNFLGRAAMSLFARNETPEEYAPVDDREFVLTLAAVAIALLFYAAAFHL